MKRDFVYFRVVEGGLFPARRSQLNDPYDRSPIFISSPIHRTSHEFTYITRPPPPHIRHIHVYYPSPPPPTYDGPGTAYGRPFLSQENPSSPSHRNPAYLVRPPFPALVVIFRAPSPYPSFARFPPFPLLGGAIAEPGIRLVGIFGGSHTWDISSSSVTN